jgi:hypothetical protein
MKEGKKHVLPCYADNFLFFISCLKIKSTSKLVVEGKLSRQQLDLKFESPYLVKEG